MTGPKSQVGIPGNLGDLSSQLRVFLGLPKISITRVELFMKTTKDTQILAGKKPVNQETYPLSTC